MEHESTGNSPGRNDKLQKKRSISSLWKSSNAQAQEFEPPPSGTRHARRKSPQIDVAFATRGNNDNEGSSDKAQDYSDDEGTAPDRDTLEVFSQMQEWFKTTGADQEDDYRDPSSQPSQSQGDSETHNDIISPNGITSPIMGESDNWWQSITGGLLDGAPQDSGADAAAGSSLLDEDQSPDDMLSLFVEWIKTTQRGEGAATPNQDNQKGEERKSAQEAEDTDGEKELPDMVSPRFLGKDDKRRGSHSSAPHGSPTTSESSLKSDNMFIPATGVDPLNKESVVPTGVGWARYQAWQESNTDEAKNFRKWLQKRQAERRPSRSRMKPRTALHRKYSNSSLDSSLTTGSIDRDDNSSVTGDSYGSSYDSAKRERHNTADSGGGTHSGSPGGSVSREEEVGDVAQQPVEDAEEESKKDAAEASSFDFFPSIDTSAIENLFTSSNQEEDKDKVGPEELLDQLGEWMRDTLNLTSPMLRDGRSRSSSGNSMHSEAHSSMPTMGEVWNPIHARSDDDESASNSYSTAHVEPSGRRRTSSDQQASFIDLDWSRNKVEEWVTEQTSEFETRRASVQADAEEISNKLKKSLFGFMSTNQDKGVTVDSVQVARKVDSPEVDRNERSLSDEGGGLFDQDDFEVDPNVRPDKYTPASSEFDDDNDFSHSPPGTPAPNSKPPVQLTPVSHGSQGSANKAYSDQPKPSDRSGVRNLLL